MMQTCDLTEVTARNAKFLDLAKGILQQSVANLQKGTQGATLGGYFGTAILQTVVSCMDGDQHELNMARAFRDKVAAHLAESPIRTLSLYGGLSGCAWTLNWIHEKLAEPSADISFLLDEIDTVILDRLTNSEWTGHYDLITGLVGIGTYALSRNKKGDSPRIVEAVISKLQQLNIASGRMSWWITPPPLMTSELETEAYPDGLRNLGIAHGIPGVILFLASAIRHGYSTQKVRALLNSSANFIISTILPEEFSSSFSFIAESKRSSRMAWCYGDPGVAMALSSAGKALDDSNIRNIGKTILLKSIAVSESDVGIVDASVCHGTAGLALLYYRSYQDSGDILLLDASKSWMRKTYAFRQEGCGNCGYLTFHPVERRFFEDDSYLTGATGVALALLTVAGMTEAQWDQPLLTNGR